MNFQKLLENYIKELTEKNKEENKIYPDYHFEYKINSKYTVISEFTNTLSTFCFVENSTGDIYKPANYKTPAKTARGNINNIIKPLRFSDLYIRR